MWPKDWDDEMREEARRLQNEMDIFRGTRPLSDDEWVEYEARCAARGIYVTQISSDFVKRSLKRRKNGDHGPRFKN